ncbi:MAG: DnaB-like helicase C-terminal domain-containing protein, partial [Clostridia bacterium]
VVIDYLQLMSVASSGNSRPESRQVEVSEMSRKLKIYAKELEVPILVLSQLSRSVEVRKEEPQLSDLRESGSIEQDADIVMFLHDPSKLNKALPSNQIKLLIRKNRNGNIGDIMLDWDGDTTSFREMETDENGNAVAEKDTEQAVAKPLKRSQSKDIKVEDLPFDGNANAEPQNYANANEGAVSKANEGAVSKSNEDANSKANDGYANGDKPVSQSNSRDNDAPWDTNETTIEKNERKNKEINDKLDQSDMPEPPPEVKPYEDELPWQKGKKHTALNQIGETIKNAEEILDVDDEYVDDIDSSNEFEGSDSQCEFSGSPKKNGDLLF